MNAWHTRRVQPDYGPGLCIVNEGMERSRSARTVRLAAQPYGRAETHRAIAAVRFVMKKLDQPVVGASKFSAGSPQISSAYSRMVRSDENQPMRATFNMADDAHPGVAQCSSIWRCARQ
jgi:hypothetical protein